jgi:taurine dioxygenase
MAIEIRRLSYGLGAEISGFRIAEDLDAEALAEIRQALLDYQVILIRGQEMTPEQHIRFTSLFGEQEAYPVAYFRHPDHPEIYLLNNQDENGNITKSANVAREWHSDMSWTLRPALGTALRCIQMPSYGGTTNFSNTYMAYDRLSPAYRRMIDQLYAVHQAWNSKTGIDDLDAREIERLNTLHPPVIQPIVRVHPETGRRALYVCEKTTTRLVGFTDEESEPILQFLKREAVRVEYTYRHYWQPNDLIVWDNRCTLHTAVHDNDHEQKRMLHRTTILGTPSGEFAPQDDTHWYDERDRRNREPHLVEAA